MSSNGSFRICPGCGAEVMIDEHRLFANCTYCGMGFAISNRPETPAANPQPATPPQPAPTPIPVSQPQPKEPEYIPPEPRIKIPDTVLLQEKQNYKAIVPVLEAAGFTNIKLVPLNDLTLGLIKKPDIVASITIHGKQLSSHAEYPRDAAIVISYHSFDTTEKSQIPSSLTEYKKMDFSTVEEILKGAGFTQISCVALSDLSIGLFTRPGTAESITINGHAVTVGSSYPKDSAIVITYHSRRQIN